MTSRSASPVRRSIARALVVALALPLAACAAQTEQTGVAAEADASATPAGPVVALILAMVGIQPEAIALVLGVDRFLDMCRTTLNVVGDLVAAQVISALSRNDPALALEAS